MRECGLKHFRLCLLTLCEWSLPVRECGLKPASFPAPYRLRPVTPRAGVWIETSSGYNSPCNGDVTPRAGVWIETYNARCLTFSVYVTPRAGVWIETFYPLRKFYEGGVTPRAGVWIETCHKTGEGEGLNGSLPVRECGLKRKVCLRKYRLRLVTPRAGVWIETALPAFPLQSLPGHSPCGSVD